jgi:hypothetical protein
MNLYIVSAVNVDYDEYDSHVVAACSPEQAKQLLSKPRKPTDFPSELLPNHPRTWKVVLIGTSTRKKRPGIIHSSFNAG